MITAAIVLDSISPAGHRLTTFELRYPKFIHGELMTHRAFSRNASSSRAIPVSKNLEEVRSDELRAAPEYWGAEQKGMQSGMELTGIDLASAKSVWRYAAMTAADIAEVLTKGGVHKSLVNRVMEPFLHINVLVTATEYMNFFGLRLHRDAQPEIRVLAERMWKEYQESRTRLLQPGAWHLPYLDDASIEEINDRWYSNEWQGSDPDNGMSREKASIRVSVARCARVSYQSFETGKRSTIEEDLRLYGRLVGSRPLHASPAEHVATPDDGGEDEHGFAWSHPHHHGNFIGWRQYRKLLDGEAVAPLPEGYIHA